MPRCSYGKDCRAPDGPDLPDTSFHRSPPPGPRTAFPVPRMSGICRDCKSLDLRCAEIVADARQRSRRKGVPTTITRGYVRQLWQAAAHLGCVVCGCGLVWKRGARGETRGSLDEIMPGVGYVPGNVAFLCARCNRQKQDADPAQHLEFALYQLSWTDQDPPEGFDTTLAALVDLRANANP